LTQTSGRSCRENTKLCSEMATQAPHTRCHGPLHAGHPVRRGFSAQARLSRILDRPVPATPTAFVRRRTSAVKRLRRGFPTLARRSFSEGGKPGEDELRIAAWKLNHEWQRAKFPPRRPGQASTASADPGPIMTNVHCCAGWGRNPVHFKYRWLWVPAFAGTTEEKAERSTHHSGAAPIGGPPGGRCKKVIVAYAPSHEPIAAKAT
jgi:hypothetical protein